MGNGGNYISTATSFLSTSPALGYLEAHSTAVSAPVSVSGISEGATSVAVGLSSSCAILNTGALKCWGSQAGGLLGDNTIAGTSPVPVQVSGLSSGVAGVGVGFRNACAISNTGALTCWGNNGNGQIGDNTLTLRRVPTQVSGLTSGVSAVALSGAVGSVCAIVSGAVKCWGYNDYGTIGDNTTTPSRTDPGKRPNGFVRVAFGKHHVCALKSDSTIYCWGYNQFGQLGNGTYVNATTPVQVTGLPGGATISAIGAQFQASMALTSTGDIYTWGLDLAKQSIALHPTEHGLQLTPRLMENWH